MTEEIIVKDYFNIVRDDYGRIIMIENIGYDRELIKAIRKQNELIYKLEQENKELKEENKTLNYQWHKQSEIGDEWYKVADKYKTALEEISGLTSPHCTQCSQIINIISEVLE